MDYESEQEFIVYPKVHPLEELGLPSRIVFGEVVWPQKIYQDPTKFRGLRLNLGGGNQIKKKLGDKLNIKF